MGTVFVMICNIKPLFYCRIEVICNSFYAPHIVNNSTEVCPLGNNSILTYVDIRWMSGGVAQDHLSVPRHQVIARVLSLQDETPLSKILTCFQTFTCHVDVSVTSEQYISCNR